MTVPEVSTPEMIDLFLETFTDLDRSVIESLPDRMIRYMIQYDTTAFAGLIQARMRQDKP
jgi:hypothetical protein